MHISVLNVESHTNWLTWHRNTNRLKGASVSVIRCISWLIDSLSSLSFFLFSPINFLIPFIFLNLLSPNFPFDFFFHFDPFLFFTNPMLKLLNQSYFSFNLSSKILYTFFSLSVIRIGTGLGSFFIFGVSALASGDFSSFLSLGLNFTLIFLIRYENTG